MSNRFSIIFIVFVYALIVFSCKEDNDESKKKNSMSFDGKEYLFKGVFFYNDGELHDDGPTGNYSMGVTLSAGIVYSEDGYSGNGPLLFLSLSSPDETGVAPGTYKLTDEDADIEAFQVYDIVFALDFEIGDSLLDEAAFATEGTVVVRKSGDVFTYEVTAKIDGKSFVANFTGPVIKTN